MANAVAAGASDLAMIDIMKIGGVTGWLNAMGQAEAASLPLSSHTFTEPSAHVLAVSPTAHWLEYLDIAGAVLTERLLPQDGKVAPRGPGSGHHLGRASRRVTTAGSRPVAELSVSGPTTGRRSAALPSSRCACGRRTPPSAPASTTSR